MARTDAPEPARSEFIVDVVVPLSFLTNSSKGVGCHHHSTAAGFGERSPYSFIG